MNRYLGLVNNELPVFTIHDWLNGVYCQFREDSHAYRGGEDAFINQIESTCFVDGALWIHLRTIYDNHPVKRRWYVAGELTMFGEHGRTMRFWR